MPRTNIPLANATQAGIVLARKGTTLPHEADYALLPICYYIVFHSIGSRIFDLREKQGLFYSATGMLAVDATRDNTGLDFVCTAVDPTNIETTILQLQELLQKQHSNPQVTREELRAAQRWYERLTVERLRHAESVCETFMLYKRLYPEREYYDVVREHLVRVQKATVADVNELFTRVFKAPFVHVIVSGCCQK